MFWHKHKWKVTGAQQLMRGYADKMNTPCTEVLMVCDCGIFQTRCIDGHWTLEQLQPAASAAEADKDFFRKLGVKL
jgi:hypothetical protein